MAHALATVGYESLTLPELIELLRAHGITLLVDIRAVANSRRPGFGKRKLSAGLEEAGIGYLHLRDLGTPVDGRIAARAGEHETMRRIFLEHLQTLAAQDDLHTLADLCQGKQHVCILCLEADHQHCHRRFVAEAVRELTGVAIEHLHR